MRVCSISAEEDPVVSCECFGDALPDRVQRPPVDFLELDFEGLHGLDGLLLGHFLCHTVRVLGGDFGAVCVADACCPVIQRRPQDIPVCLALDGSGKYGQPMTVIDQYKDLKLTRTTGLLACQSRQHRRCGSTCPPMCRLRRQYRHACEQSYAHRPHR